MIKLKEMKAGLRYVVVSNGTTLRKGEHIYLAKDGCLVSREAQGWLVPDDWARLRNRVELDDDYYQKEKDKLYLKIWDINKILADNK